MLNDMREYDRNMIHVKCREVTQKAGKSFVR